MNNEQTRGTPGAWGNLCAFFSTKVISNSILLTLSINACYRIYKSEFLHPQKEVCADLCALKKEPQKSQKCALKKVRCAVCSHGHTRPRIVSINSHCEQKCTHKKEVCANQCDIKKNVFRRVILLCSRHLFLFMFQSIYGIIFTWKSVLLCL
nr:MAG TPA: hypothetical protein [Caudoviricetes sp.]